MYLDKLVIFKYHVIGQYIKVFSTNVIQLRESILNKTLIQHIFLTILQKMLLNAVVILDLTFLQNTF